MLVTMFELYPMRVSYVVTLTYRCLDNAFLGYPL